MTESSESAPKPRRGFRSNKEYARLVGNDPKVAMERFFEGLQKEQDLRRSFGREPTPEERVAYQLSQGAEIHRQNGNDEMADKVMDVANKLLEGQIDMSGAWEELGLSPEPEG